MRIEEAIEVFGAGFSFTRSWTHPYLFDRVGPLWRFRDSPRKRPPHRSEQWIAYRTPAAEAHAILLAQNPGRYAVCHFRALDEPEAPIRAGWKGLGYRYYGSEKLFVHDLREIPEIDCPYPIQRVETQAPADRLAAAHRGKRQILPEHLVADPPDFRAWVAFDEDEIVGWVRSGKHGDSTWCSNMGVRPSHRRRGIAKALLSRMLASDKELGAKNAVLLASHAGALLYPHVGYEEIGELYIFTPPKG